MDFEHLYQLLSDPTNFALILAIFAAVFTFVFGALYMYCCIVSMRGDLDLIRDEETGQPLNHVFFMNPFKKRPSVRAINMVVSETELNQSH